MTGPAQVLLRAMTIDDHGVVIESTLRVNAAWPNAGGWAWKR